ncbi:MAG: glycosyl hydrolase-related protein [bacterium]
MSGLFVFWLTSHLILSQPGGEVVKRIYIACDDHTDYMWSGDAQTYEQAFLRMLDYYLDLADKTENFPSEYQSRFVCDGYYWMVVYEQNRTRAEFDTLISRIRDGHITVPLNPLCCCMGAAPAEAVLRSLYYPGRIERQYRLTFPLVISMENQTLSCGLASLWAGSGAQYGWKGICGCATKLPHAGDRQHDIYYYTGMDGQKILMKWNSMLTDNQGMGGYAEARNPRETIRYVDADPQFQSRYPFPIIGCFGNGWDDLETRTDEFSRIAREMTTPRRQIIVSNILDFFEDFEKHYAGRLPSETCSYGNEWELLLASLARESAQIKRSVEKLRSAEALAAVLSRQDPDFVNSFQAEKEKAHINLGLFFEHDWTGDGPVPRNEREQWQKKITADFVSFVERYHEACERRFAEALSATGTNPRFYVFNPLGWIRTDYADIPWAGSGDFQMIDRENQQPIPFQSIEREGRKMTRVWVENVPAAGYKTVEIRPGKGEPFADPFTVQGATLENEYYRVTLSPGGSITSLVGKKLRNQEFVGEINHRAWNDIGSATGEWRVIDSGPVSVSLEARSPSPVRRVTTVTLYRDKDRLDIENEILRNFTDILTYDFALRMERPEVYHEETGAILRAKKVDHGGNYAARTARTDWLTLNHFVDINGENRTGVTLSNADAYFFRLGHSTVETLDEDTPLISVLIGGQVDGRNLGMWDQGGNEYFQNRFALRAHGPYDPVEAMKFSLEHQNPLIAGKVTGANPQLPDQGSLLRISNPSILLWVLKPAEENGGEMVLRLWNVSSSPQSTTLQTLPAPIQKAWAATHVETNRGEIPVSGNGITVAFEKQQMRTLRLKF